MKLRSDERLDDLNIQGYKIIQKPKGFCFGIDAVLLSHFVVLEKEENCLDLGTGTGIIPILLAAHYSNKQLIGLELQEDYADMAQRSVDYNRLEDRVSIIQGDIKQAATVFAPSSFAVVTSNPPYIKKGKGLLSARRDKMIARHELECTLGDVVCQAAQLLQPRGRFYMIHRVQRMAEIMDTLSRYRLEPKRIRLVHPTVDKEANLILVESVKGGSPSVKVMAPLIMYDEQANYTLEMRRLGKEEGE